MLFRSSIWNSDCGRISCNFGNGLVFFIIFIVIVIIIRIVTFIIILLLVNCSGRRVCICFILSFVNNLGLVFFIMFVVIIVVPFVD